MNRSPRRAALALAAALAAASLGGCSKELVCPPDQVGCDGQCVSPSRDRHHCGGCGIEASPLQECLSGALACAADVDVCGGACIDTARDPRNCGSCGRACGAGELCDAASATCVPATSCAAGRNACAGACVDLANDRFHCGGCGRACDPGQRCRAGVCRAELYVACMNTNEVVPVTATLGLAGDPLDTPGAPQDLVTLGSELYVASTDYIAKGHLSLLGTGRRTEFASYDLQRMAVAGRTVLLTNPANGTLLVFDATGTLLAEIPLPDQQFGPNPHGVAMQGSTAWVALYGGGASSGQKLARVDLHTRQVVGTVDLLGLPGTSTAPGLPLPDAVAADADRVFVTLKNLADDPADQWAFFSKPAGPGRLLVLTPATGGVAVLDLPECGSPGDAVLHGSTLWLTCGAYSFPELAPRRLLALDVSGPSPVLAGFLELGGIVPSKLAFCGGLGYVGDMASGAVVRFDPSARVVSPPVSVCPAGPYGYTAVADLACPQ